MRLRIRAALFGGGLLLGCPAVAQAGMPTVDLTDMARMRVQTISFFLAGLLLSAIFVKLIWNRLRRDFTSLPRLNYGKALGVVVLCGLLFVLVLLMISGARELMTPGAWEKRGLTYRLAGEPDAPPADTQPETQRRQRLERIRTALWEYARSHDGRFPSDSAAAEIPDDLWRTGSTPANRCQYVAGLTADEGAKLLVYEPAVYGDRRLVLLTNGTIRFTTPQEVGRKLPEGR